MAIDKIIIKGAREHNLKNISVELPRDKLIVITGLSGQQKQFKKSEKICNFENYLITCLMRKNEITCHLTITYG